MDRSSRRRTLDALDKLDEIESKQFGDPETVTRIAQYELAYRMQISVPEVFDISKEPKDIHEMYGTKPGEASFANNCLLARRLVERGVRHVQLYDWGWDCHGTGAGDDIVKHLPDKCREVDRPVNVLALDDTPPVAEMARAGVARISVGGGFAFAAVGAVVAAATELREQGTYGWRAGAAAGAVAARRAFG